MGKCPHCDGAINPMLTAAKESRISMRIEFSGPISAKSVGQSIIEFRKLLVAVGRDLGGKMDVIIENIDLKEQALQVDFVVFDVKQRP